MSETIPLTKDGGLDPRLTFCPRCKCDTNEIVIGDNRLITHNNGETAITPRTRVNQTIKKLGWSRSDCRVGILPEGKVPATDYCDSCKEELEEYSSIVKNGGVYWRCQTCSREGVIKPSEYADLVREAANIPAPDPCGVEFTSCNEHGGENDLSD